MKSLLVLLLVLSLGFMIPGQLYNTELPEETDYKKLESFPVQNLLEDLEECYELIKTRHPDPYAYISESDLEALYQETRFQIKENMNSLDFNRLMTSFISRIGDGHIWFGMPGDERENFLQESSFIPLNVKVIGDELYISSAIEDHEELRGKKILSINGMNSAEILNTILLHYNSDGNQKWQKYIHIENNFPLAYARFIGSYKSYALELEDLGGQTFELIMEGVGKSDFEKYTGKLPQEETLTFEEFPEKNIAYMGIKSFDYYGAAGEEFRTYVDACFEKVFSEDYENLIIDLRGNGGGDPFAAVHLLSYIMREEYQYFAEVFPGYYSLSKKVKVNDKTFMGNLYILIDGGSFSTTGHILSLLKYHERGIMIGTPSGGTYFCNDNSKDFILSNTGFRIYLPTSSFYTAVEGIEKGMGIQPDYFVEVKPEDLITGRDTVLEFVLEKIEEEKNKQ